MDDLDAIPVEDFEVTSVPSPEPNKFNTKEFCETIYKELSEGQIWRTSKTLAEKLNVDVVELDNFLRAQNVVCCRSSKKEGIFLYALVKRVEEVSKKDESKAELLTRPLVSEDDRYALACFHSALIILETTLNKFAVKVHERNPEAFTNLVAGKNKLEAGIVLFGNKLKADFSKLPKV